MLRRLILVTFLALPVAAEAQMASYCAGSVVADLFDTRVTPGSSTRATYSVTLRNTQGTDRMVRIQVLGSMTDRPTGQPMTLRGGQRVTVPLGYQTVLSAGQALRGEQLANVTRVSCG